MKYLVEFTRFSYARQTLEIEAESVAKAKSRAKEQAPEEEFSTYESEYEVSAVQPETASGRSIPTASEVDSA
jgi:hypothetical protein